jgi:RHS repeat-associated protein
MALTRNTYQRNSSWNAPYTFSGKEKDAETGYGYFGARYYDSGLSIWLYVDPMSDKYPSMSPYNYCANNPVILVDPDGRRIKIYYTEVDQFGKTIHKAFIFNGKNHSKAPNNPYVQNFLKAYDYNIKNGGGGKTKEAAESTTYMINLVFAENTNRATIAPFGKDESMEPVVYWDPQLGHKTTDGYKISPASALEEEFNHIMSILTDPDHNKREGQDDKKYDNLEEKRVKNNSSYTKTAAKIKKFQKDGTKKTTMEN